MTRYVALLEKEPKTLWSVWFPDISGCITAAETMTLALENAVDALRLWAEYAMREGEELPLPRTPEELREDPYVRASLEVGSCFIMVPLLLEKGRTVRVNITLDAGSLEAIDDAAKERGLTRSAFLVSSALEKIAS